MEEVLDDDPGFRKMETMEEEEIKGIDFGDVNLIDKNSTRNLLEDDNFDF
jgi:hypothetical protein